MNQVAVLSVTSHILYGSLLLGGKYILLIAWTIFAEIVAHSSLFLAWINSTAGQMMHYFCTVLFPKELC